MSRKRRGRQQNSSYQKMRNECVKRLTNFDRFYYYLIMEFSKITPDITNMSIVAEQQYHELPQLRMSQQFSPKDYIFQQVTPQQVRGTTSQEISNRKIAIQQQMQRSFYVVVPKLQENQVKLNNTIIEQQQALINTSQTHDQPINFKRQSDFEASAPQFSYYNPKNSNRQSEQNCQKVKAYERNISQEPARRNITPEYAITSTEDQINLLRQYKERMHKAIKIFNEQKKSFDTNNKQTLQTTQPDEVNSSQYSYQKSSKGRTNTQMNRRNNKELKNIDKLQSFIKQQIVSFYEQNLVQSPNSSQLGINGMFGLSFSRPALECKGHTINHALPKRERDATPIGPFEPVMIAIQKKPQLPKRIVPNFEDVKKQQVQHSMLIEVKELAFKKKQQQLEQYQRSINLYLKQVNDFVNSTLKFKTTITPSHITQIKQKAKLIGLKFHNSEIDARFINSKDFVSVLKKVYCVLNDIIIPPQFRPKEKNDTTVPQKYKFWVECSGNNHNLVKTIFKRRSWLSWVDVNPEAIWAGVGPQIPNIVWTQVKQKRIINDLGSHQIYNHVDGIAEIGQKSNFYINMKQYYDDQGLNVNDYLPETFLIPLNSDFESDKIYQKFCQQFKAGEMWIYKPGEASNRGNGIKVLNDLNKIEEHIVQEIASNGRNQGRYSNFILQRYIMNPMLIEKRKFDLRVFALFTAHAESKMLRGYFYDEGYLRTSCKEYDLTKVDNRLIHLTNDAVQKFSADYGKYESSNKLSYNEFEKILLKEKCVSFYDEILPKIKARVTDVFLSVKENLYLPENKYSKIDTGKNKPIPFYNGYELLGIDFMLDDDLNLTIIEVNTNPCLDTPCILLHRLIPQVLDQTLKLAVDPFTVANQQQYYLNSEFIVQEIKFQLVYEAPITTQLFQKSQQLEAIQKVDKIIDNDVDIS